ncbi:MAG: hypothetical protein KDI33_14000 [Halioglobus sp.]|nr:hypothetical protein [Halioglobus sp.]
MELNHLIARPATIRKAIDAIDGFNRRMTGRQHIATHVTLTDIVETNARCRKVLVQLLERADGA